MKPLLFVDSGAWIALSDESDQHHTEAKRVYPTLLAGHRLVTTNLVASECYTYLRRRHGSGKALTFLAALRQSGRIEVVYSDADLETDAVTILRQYDDQMFTYTDAVSFALMKVRGIALAFAFDIDFAIAGFERVPKPS